MKVNSPLPPGITLSSFLTFLVIPKVENDENTSEFLYGDDPPVNRIKTIQKYYGGPNKERTQSVS